jgi:PAS domain S-box-containing protein
MFNKRKYTYVKLLLVYFLLAVCIGTAGFFYYRNLRQDIFQEKRDELSSIAGLKMEQLAAWRRERMSDANFIFNQADIAHTINNLKKNPGSLRLSKEIRKWMTSMYLNGHYAEMLVLAPDSRVLLSLPGGTSSIGPFAAQLTAEAAREKRVLFSDIYRGRENKLRLDLIVPLFVGGEWTGSVVLRIDPREVLFPLVQSWPTPSGTAEVVLVRREGDDVVILNDLRHRKDSALALRLPVNRAGLASALGFHSGKAIREGIDYRGVPVLAAIRNVPDSSWFLIAKIDRSEVFKDLGASLRLLGLIGTLLAAAAALLTGYIWRKRSAEFYRREYESEQQKNSLMQRYEYLSKYANDIILFMDDQGGILDANERAVSTYGYERAELLSMNIRDLGAPETLPEVDQELQIVKMRNGYIFETVHKNKSGALFPVEISSIAIDMQGEKFIDSIIRNVADRKKADEELLRSEQKYRSLFENMIEGFAHCRMLFENDRPEDFIYLDVNDSFGSLTGLKDVVGKRVSEVIQGIRTTNPELFEIYGRVALSGNQERFETYVEPLKRWFSVSVYSPEKGHFVAVFDNITERKRAEADLLKSNEQLEERIAERTLELKKKNEELERMNRLFVGRELKMIELKERLKELEGKASGEDPELREKTE